MTVQLPTKFKFNFPYSWHAEINQFLIKKIYIFHFNFFLTLKIQAPSKCNINMLLYLIDNEVKPTLGGKPSKVKFPHIFMMLRRFAI